MKIVVINVLHFHTVDELLGEGVVKSFKRENGEVIASNDVKAQVNGTVVLLVVPQKDETLAQAVYRVIEERIFGAGVDFGIEIVSEMEVDKETIVFQQGI